VESQAEAQALRDKAEELADDVRNLSILIHSLRTALASEGRPTITVALAKVGCKAEIASYATRVGHKARTRLRYPAHG
jgi:hypothetical protein